MSGLHRVTWDELPVVQEWLKQYLPDSYSIYSTITSVLQGRWEGLTVLTLGWPDIRAVGGKYENENGHPCAEYLSTCITIFSPCASDLETLLTWPGYLDWDNDIQFCDISRNNVEVVETLCRSQPCLKSFRVHPVFLMHLEPGNIQTVSIPDGYVLRQLDPETDVDFIATTRRKQLGFHKFLAELIKCFPSMGLYDEKGTLLSFEVGTEIGTIGKLFTSEEHRGRGFGKAVATELAKVYIREGLPVYTAVEEDNEPSYNMHIKLGFRPSGKLTWCTYTPVNGRLFLS